MLGQEVDGMRPGLTAALAALILSGPAMSAVVVEANFNDGRLAPFEATSYDDGEFAVEVVDGAGVDGSSCVRLHNIDEGARAAAKYSMRYRRGLRYTISFMARAEEGTSRVTAYLDAGDWRDAYPGGYFSAVEVGEQWQHIVLSRVHQQGRGYLANVRIVQPPGGGSVARPNLLWVSEVGAY